MAGPQKMNRPPDAADLPYSGSDPRIEGGNDCVHNGNEWYAISKAPEETPIRSAPNYAAEDTSHIQGQYQVMCTDVVS